MPQQMTLSVYRGDSYHWEFTLFSDPEKTQPYDLTGAEAKAEIRPAPGGQVQATLGCVITPPNQIGVDLTAEDSATLAIAAARWDLQLTWAADGKVKTVVAGPVVVEADITDSVAGLADVSLPRTSAWEQQRKQAAS